MQRHNVIIVLLAAALMVSIIGCGKKEEAPEAETPGPAQTPPEVSAETSAPTETKPPTAETAETSAVQDAAAQAELAAQSAKFLGEVLVSWNLGRKDVATKQFLAVQWSDAIAFQGVPMLAMSEQQLASLSPQQRTRVAEETQGLVGTLRAVAKYVIEAGQKRAAAGDAEGAKAHYAAVKECGEALVSPQRLQLVQMAGKAMAELAQQELNAAP